MFHWYAARILFNKFAYYRQMFDSLNIETFVVSRKVYDEETVPTDNDVPYKEVFTLGSLIFIRTEEEFMQAFRREHGKYFWPYCQPDRVTPVPIPDKEMEIFQIVCRNQDQIIDLGEDKLEYHLGDRVRVTHGIFKGAEGHIKKIKGDRRLIVTVNGISAIATTFIPFAWLEKI
jgi:hypothetical protein